jgi:hypothetical protein
VLLHPSLHPGPTLMLVEGPGSAPAMLPRKQQARLVFHQATIPLTHIPRCARARQTTPARAG